MLCLRIERLLKSCPADWANKADWKHGGIKVGKSGPKYPDYPRLVRGALDFYVEEQWQRVGAV